MRLDPAVVSCCAPTLMKTFEDAEQLGLVRPVLSEKKEVMRKSEN